MLADLILKVLHAIILSILLPYGFYVTNELNISAECLENFPYQIIDLQGKVVQVGVGNVVNLNLVESGTYLIRCTFGQTTESFRFVKL